MNLHLLFSILNTSGMWLYPIVGILAGMLAGLLGIGGGVIVVPSLLYLFSYQGFPQDVLMHYAIGTSLATMIITASASVTAHHYHRNVMWSVILRLLPGIMIGVVAGALLAHQLPSRILELLFGCFVLFVSANFLLNRKPKASRKLPGFLGLAIVGVLIGFKSGVLGVGGGAIIIPFLVYCNVPMKKAGGTSAGCTLPIAILGTIVFMLQSHAHMALPYSTGYIYWPALIGMGVMSALFAPFGAKLAKHTNVLVLKRIFAIFLLFVGINLIF